MGKQVIMPALGIAQEVGVIVRWLKKEGEAVDKGETLLEIETDKATVEIEAPASGILSEVTGEVGVEIPVGEVIAMVRTAEEMAQGAQEKQRGEKGKEERAPEKQETRWEAGRAVSPVAARIAAEHNLDLSQIAAEGRRISKADVVNYIQSQEMLAKAGQAALQGQNQSRAQDGKKARLLAASPKARRLATEQGKDLARIVGSGPDGAVIVKDVLAALERVEAGVGSAQGAYPRVDERIEAGRTQPTEVNGRDAPEVVEQESGFSRTWRIMAERTTQSWTSVPHFYLVREVLANRLGVWRAAVQKRSREKITYTDLLVKVIAAVLKEHPTLNATWQEGKLQRNASVNMGLAVAVEEGLVVPVIHRANELSLAEIAQRRQELIERAQSRRLRPEDLQGGTFTLSNLGMYGVDAFNAIINPPQVAILAVGRIAQRVVPVEERPQVMPTMVLSLSCDHRAVDGARGAQFLSTLADMLEEPLLQYP